MGPNDTIDILYDEFKKFGELDYIYPARAKVEKRRYGFANVIYHRDADQAREHFRFSRGCIFSDPQSITGDVNKYELIICKRCSLQLEKGNRRFHAKICEKQLREQLCNSATDTTERDFPTNSETSRREMLNISPETFQSLPALRVGNTTMFQVNNQLVVIQDMPMETERAMIEEIIEELATIPVKPRKNQISPTVIDLINDKEISFMSTSLANHA